MGFDGKMVMALALIITQSLTAFAASKPPPDRRIGCETPLLWPESAKAANQFDRKVLHEVLKSTPINKNTLLAAPALNSAIAMVANGASGPAQAEVLAALGYKTNQLDLLNSTTKQMMRTLNRSSDGVVSSLASHLFTDNDFKVLDSFKQTLMQNGGETSSHAFHDDSHGTANAINGWTAKSTKNLITNIIDSDTVGSLESLLASVFYFKGTWKYQFDKEKTYGDRFQTGSGESKIVPMMHQVIPKIRAYHTKDYLIARIPYVGDSVAMYIAFPNLDWTTGKPAMSADQTLQEALKNGDLEKFWSGDKNVTEHENEELVLPKFKIKYSNKQLKDVIQALGVNGIFSGGSLLNLSADPRLFVAYIRIDSLLEVNEEGSEAAGVASVGMALESMRTNPFEFNRAFGVVIRDDKENLNLVTGVIQDPTDLVESEERASQAESRTIPSQGAIARQVINKILFGGESKGRRLTSKNGDCSVWVKNDDASGTTEIIMQKGMDERRFLISEADPTLIDRSSIMPNDPLAVSVTTGKHGTSSFKLDIVVGSKGEKSFMVSIGTGIGRAWKCKVLN